MTAARQYPRGVAAAVVLVVCLSVSPAALAQRFRANATGSISSPGSLRINTVDSSSVGQFNNYSYGLGSPGAVYSGGGGIGRAVPRGPFGGGAGASGSPSFSMPGAPGFAGGAGTGTTTLYRATGPETDMGNGMLSRQLTLLTRPDRMTGAALMSSFVLDKTAVLQQEGQPLTTFVPGAIDPENPNRYVELLIEGEQAMRNRRYRDAADVFIQVRHVAPRAPESLLSQAHAELGTGNYWLMANDIRLAIQEFPELPLAKIELRGFFANSAEFVDLREQLRRAAGVAGLSAATSAPSTAPAAVDHVDATVLLSLAYVEWFDGNGAVARKYLVQAARISTDPLLSDGIEVFWRGIVRAGGAQGELVEQAGLVAGQRTAEGLASPSAVPAAPAARPS